MKSSMQEATEEVGGAVGKVGICTFSLPCIPFVARQKSKGMEDDLFAPNLENVIRVINTVQPLLVGMCSGDLQGSRAIRFGSRLDESPIEQVSHLSYYSQGGRVGQSPIGFSKQKCEREHTGERLSKGIL